MPLLPLLALACQPAPSEPTAVPFTYDERPLTALVDPLLGTTASGNTIPGALVPHGMVRASPDTHGPVGRIQAYDYSDTALDGFTHTNLEGPGGSANGYSQLLVLPQTGALDVDPDTRAVFFDHAGERAVPGRYEVTLGNGVHATLTATGHAAVHRYAFPAGPARLLVDLGASQFQSTGGQVTLEGATLRGFGDYNVHAFAGLLPWNGGTTGRSRLYLWAEASVVPGDVGTFAGRTPSPGATTEDGPWTGAWLGWTFDAPTTVELRVGVSMISEDQARRNLEAEVGGASLEEVAAAADAAWNHLLNRVVVEADPSTERQLYTALYRSYMQPADYTEADGSFVNGSSGEAVVLRDQGFRYYTDDWCLWDTFRTSHPLSLLTEPEIRADVLRSMLVPHEQGGWLDKCSWQATGYSRVMIGNHGVPVFADAYVKGFRGVDEALAWEAVDKVGTEELPDLPQGICGYVNMGTPPDYLRLGWVPDECDPGQSASMTLEHAYDDWTAARFAEALGREEDARAYDLRGAFWRNLWDERTGFIRPRDAAGAWREPFDPAAFGDFVGFTEASSWIYTWFVPQDIPGLIAAMGGPAPFVARLDTFFADGLFDASNEPSFHVPFLYAHAGQPWRTSEVVQDIVATRFGEGPAGLPGNDDSGAMSAWLVFAMLGLYPVTPGDPTYTLSTPLVRRAELRLHPDHFAGGTFVIEVEGDRATAPYIGSVTLDGVALERPFLRHAELAAGGTLRVTLTDQVGAWGAFEP